MKKRKLFSRQMLAFEFRNTIGNPYIHIFGVGLPILMLYVISRSVTAELNEPEILSMVVTSLFLGVGAIIPMATVLMGYGVSHAQELEKGIPQRMELFGIPERITMCNRVVAEGIFMVIAFGIYFAAAFLFIDVEAPVISGISLYMVCILILSIILFCLAHAISTLVQKFGLTYCITMLLYFVFMIFGGMMGITYDNMPGGMQQIAKLLPITYINRDFYTVWSGESYNFVPMLQSYLFLAAAAGILLFLAGRKRSRKLK